MTPEISIIVPCYNAEKTLQRCLDSIKAAADGLSIEVLLINDGSTDNTLKVCQQNAVDWPAFRVFSQDNKGAGATRNRGLRETKGEFIGFVDADDWISPNHFKNMHKAMIERGADMVATNFIEITEQGRRKGCQFDKKELYSASFLKPKQLYREDFVRHHLIPEAALWNKLFRKAIIRDNDLTFDVDLVMVEDKVFVLEYSLCCRRIVLLDEASYFYDRRNENSLTKNYAGHYDTLKALIDVELSIIRKYETLNKQQSLAVYFQKARQIVQTVGRAKKIRQQPFGKRYKIIKHILNQPEIRQYRPYVKEENDKGSKFLWALLRLMKYDQPFLLTVLLSIKPEKKGQ